MKRSRRDLPEYERNFQKFVDVQENEPVLIRSSSFVNPWPKLLTPKKNHIMQARKFGWAKSPRVDSMKNDEIWWNLMKFDETCFGPFSAVSTQIFFFESIFVRTGLRSTSRHSKCKKTIFFEKKFFLRNSIFSSLGRNFRCFFNCFSRNFEVWGRDLGMFSPSVKKKFKNLVIVLKNDVSKIWIL